MIDVKWFSRIIGFAHPNLAGKDQEKICAELGEVYEVMPFIVMAEGFKDWPNARATMRQVANGYTRPSMMRPESSAWSTSSPARSQLRQQMGLLLDGTDISEELANPAIQQPIAQVKRVESLVRTLQTLPTSSNNNPGFFILAE